METKYTEIDIREKTYEYLIPLGFENKSRLHTDGYGKLKTISYGPYMLREAKRDIDFKDTNNLYKILLQCLKYLYDIAQEGEITPEILMIHDHSGYVVLHTNPLIKYISNEDYNWTIRASEMSIQNNRKLFDDIKKDELIILPLTKSFINDGKTLKRQVEDMLKGKKRRLPAVTKKLLQFFDPYEKNVILDKTLNQVEKVNLFINNILHPELVHPNDKLKNVLHTLHGTVKIDRKEYDRLFQYLDLNWSEREKSKIVQFQDALIEESRRREKGEFFTPPLLVDAGWDLMYNAEGGKDRVLNDFGIWDNCAGTCNITKPLGNKPLNIWLSSLEYDDLVTAKTIGVNTNSKIFAHNFLNEDISVYGSYAEKSLYK